MNGAVAEIRDKMSEDILATDIAEMWQSWDNARNGHKRIVKEVRNYVFATDTKTTTNSQLPWKNSTTIPEMCRIRDSLHANYMATLFPSDDAIEWEAHSDDLEDLAKRRIIKAYIANKLRQSNFRTLVSKLVYDWIDTGNVFVTSDYVHDFYTDEETLENITVYSGPKAKRISYYDIVFNPIAEDFESSPKVVRSLISVGDLHRMVAERPEMGYLQEAIKRAEEQRSIMAQYSSAEVEKAVGVQIDGFGSYHEYLQSEYVELLTFYGDIYDKDNNTYARKRMITVIDRMFVIQNVPVPNWLGSINIFHTSWRNRPDNLYGMGPLENLVGMQYRIDHLENLKSDAWDLSILPILKIRGNVEEFDMSPLEEIQLGDDGDVDLLRLDLGAIIQADSQTALLASKMEEMAGSPKETSGFRTPGEKTKFEVQTLAQGASRLFQAKIVQFEVEVLEPLLNSMLEQARRNLDGADVIRVLDEELGIEEFITITKEDLKAKGKIRPIGARHFAQQAQLVQNYQGFRGLFGADPSVMSHISGIKEAELFQRILGFEKESLVEKNIRIYEQAETARTAARIQELDQTTQQEQIDSLPE